MKRERGQEMKKVCYFCASDMGEEYGNHLGRVFYSVCDKCSDRFRLEERLPGLLLAIARLRKQNGNKDCLQPVETLAVAK